MHFARQKVHRIRGEDQDNQEERADALPDLDINPQDLGKGQGDSDTTDPLELEELLDEENSEDDLEEADSVKASTEGTDYPAAGLDSGTDSYTSGNSSGEIYSPKAGPSEPAVQPNQGKQAISAPQTITVDPQVLLKGWTKRAQVIQAPPVRLQRGQRALTSDHDPEGSLDKLRKISELQNLWSGQVTTSE